MITSTDISLNQVSHFYFNNTKSTNYNVLYPQNGIVNMDHVTSLHPMYSQIFTNFKNANGFWKIIFAIVIN